MRQLRKQATYKPEYNPKATYGIGKTMPDDALSLKQLLFNYSRGMDIPMREAEYYGDIDMPDVGSMDLSEIESYSKNLKSQIDKLEKKIKESQKAAYAQRVENERNSEKKEKLKNPEDSVKTDPQPTDNQ